MQKKLTKLQSYNAMLIFLDTYYWKNRSDNLCDFITYAYFWLDGKPADPAAWPEWKDALNLTAYQDKKLRNKNSLTQLQALQTMINFFQHYCDLYTEIPSDMIIVLNILKDLKENRNHSVMWQEWVHAMDEVILKKDPRFYMQVTSTKVK